MGGQEVGTVPGRPRAAPRGHGGGDAEGLTTGRGDWICIYHTSFGFSSPFP
jgi:hypothetical protein